MEAVESPYIKNVTTEQFEQEVMAASQSTYVLVDFWAPWCQPCQGLKPILQKLAVEYNGAFTLALVNTDEEQMLAQQVGVRSLPTVVLIKDGALVDQFMGGLPESEVKEFLDKHIPTLEAEISEGADADALFSAGDYANAAIAYQAILAENEDDTDALLGLADCYLQLDEIDGTKEILANLTEEQKSHERAKSIQARIHFANLVSNAPSQAELEATLTTTTNDMKSLHLLGIRYLLSGQDSLAMDQFLKMMQTDMSYEDGLPKKTMLDALSIVDNKALISKYRQKMASLILV